MRKLQDLRMLFYQWIGSLKEKCLCLSRNLCSLLVRSRLTGRLYRSGLRYRLSPPSMRLFKGSKKLLILKGSRKKLFHSMKQENSLLKLTRQLDHSNPLSAHSATSKQTH